MTECVDLMDVAGVAPRLLDDPLAWRVRVVEQIDVDSPTHALRRRSLQCAPLRPVLADMLRRERATRATAAMLVLPVAPMPKGPLLDLDIEGPGGSQAFLLQRAAIAAQETAYLAVQAHRSGIGIDPPARQVVEYALGFTEAHWKKFRPNLLAYLAEGLGDPSPAEVARWTDVAARVAEILAPFADVPDPLDSAVENPLLVVPSLVAALGWSPTAVTDALDRYERLLARAASVAMAGDEHGFAARTFLLSLRRVRHALRPHGGRAGTPR